MGPPRGSTIHFPSLRDHRPSLTNVLLFTSLSGWVGSFGREGKSGPCNSILGAPVGGGLYHQRDGREGSEHRAGRGLRISLCCLLSQAGAGEGGGLRREESAGERGEPEDQGTLSDVSSTEAQKPLDQSAGQAPAQLWHLGCGSCLGGVTRSSLLIAREI